MRPLGGNGTSICTEACDFSRLAVDNFTSLDVGHDCSVVALVETQIGQRASDWDFSSVDDLQELNLKQAKYSGDVLGMNALMSRGNNSYIEPYVTGEQPRKF